MRIIEIDFGSGHDYCQYVFTAVRFSKDDYHTYKIEKSYLEDGSDPKLAKFDEFKVITVHEDTVPAVVMDEFFKVLFRDRE